MRESLFGWTTQKNLAPGNNRPSVEDAFRLSVTNTSKSKLLKVSQQKHKRFPAIL